MHLIRFPSRSEHKRAIMALLAFPGEFVGLPDYQMVVSEAQAQALENAKVSFEYLSRTRPNGTKTASVQS